MCQGLADYARATDPDYESSDDGCTRLEYQLDSGVAFIGWTVDADVAVVAR